VRAALIETVDLHKEYQMGGAALHALRGVSLRVAAGEFVAVMGPSGSGKSTLINLLGLLDRPSAGRYLLDGSDVSDLDADRRAALRNRSVGFVFQTFNLLARSTALENVALPLIYAGVARAEQKLRAAAALEVVGLAQRVAHWPHQLSGGKQQRVAIARALVSDPALILADEPTGALDSRTGLEIMACLQGLNRAGRTVVLVTHDHGVARHAGRIVSMQDGRVIDDAPVLSPTDARAAADGRSHTRHGGRAAFASRPAERSVSSLESLRVAIRALRANALRSALAMLGIVIGVAAVITMVAIGGGAQGSGAGADPLAGGQSPARNAGQRGRGHRPPGRGHAPDPDRGRRGGDRGRGAVGPGRGAGGRWQRAPGAGQPVCLRAHERLRVDSYGRVLRTRRLDPDRAQRPSSPPSPDTSSRSRSRTRSVGTT
jgi:macrolide transport system ATP-binding/permease protein